MLNHSNQRTLTITLQQLTLITVKHYNKIKPASNHCSQIANRLNLIVVVANLALAWLATTDY